LSEIKLPSIRRWLSISLSIGLVVALLMLVLTIDRNTWSALARLRPLYLFSAAMLVVIVWLVQANLFQSLMAAVGSKVFLTKQSALQVYLVTFFFGGITPFASGELPATCFMLNRLGTPLGEAGAVAFLRAALTRIFFTAAGIVFIIFFPDWVEAQPLISRIFTYALALGVATSLFYLFLVLAPSCPIIILKGIKSILAAQLKQVPALKVFFSRVESELRFFTRAASRIRNRPGRVVLPFILTGLYWLGLFSIAPLLLLGLGFSPHYVNAIIWQAMVQFVIAYVPLPGGSGVAELGVASLFAAFVPAHILGMFILSWRFFTFYLTLLSGGLVVLGCIDLRNL